MADSKIINDSVHGHMEFHSLCMKVIDTPEFQRLRNIRQMGLTHLVYPSAAHSRFEHSLGVCHLAGMMIEELKKNTPSIVISDVEKLCVQLAGLCHDLGHGPFSHLWEVFLKRNGIEWRHETQSVNMFARLLERNNLYAEFARNGLGPREIEFIKALIQGNGEPLNPENRFLFQVVNNRNNDIDVDKWDYYLRDGLHLNLKIPFDHTRLMKFIRIMPIEEENNNQILVFRDKEAYSIYEMFNVRAKIHFVAAQHKVVLVLDRMLIDALGAANEHFLVGGSLSEAHEDLEKWTKLTDNIFYDILYKDCHSLGPSQDILNNILMRQLYKFITSKEVSSANEIDPLSLTMNLENDLAQQFPSFGLVVSYCWFRFTSMEEDPFNRVYFYDKRNPNQLVTKRWNEIELFRSLDDPDPRPYCKIYVFSKRLCLREENAYLVKSVFPRILQNRLAIQ